MPVLLFEMTVSKSKQMKQKLQEQSKNHSTSITL